MPENALESRIESEGFATVDGVLPAAKIDRLLDDIQSTSRHAILSRRNGGVFGGRDLLSESAEIRAVSQSEAVTALVTSTLGAAARPVRAIYFDKNPDANWAVAWHQDRTIAVRHRIDVDGYGPWSRKAGIDHVEPPIALLEAMLTLRLHLDDCGADNGPLLVVPGSHRGGASMVQRPSKSPMPIGWKLAWRAGAPRSSCDLCCCMRREKLRTPVTVGY